MSWDNQRGYLCSPKATPSRGGREQYRDIFTNKEEGSGQSWGLVSDSGYTDFHYLPVRERVKGEAAALVG